MNSALKIQIDDLGNKKIVRIAGRLDTASSQALENKLQHLMEELNKFILIDFQKVDYLSSAGMRVLISFTKKLKAVEGRIVFFNLSEEVMEMIKMAGFESILSIYPSEKEALNFL